MRLRSRGPKNSSRPRGRRAKDMITCHIEPEGLEMLLVGLKHPAFIENRFIKALYCGLSLEWIERQTKERELLINFDLPSPEGMSREELLAAAGVFYGIHESIDTG